MFAKSIILTTLLIGFLVSVLHAGCDDSSLSINHSDAATITSFCELSSCDLRCADETPSLNDHGDQSHHDESQDTCQCNCHIPLLPLETAPPALNQPTLVKQLYRFDHDRLPSSPSLLLDKPPII